MTLDLVCRTLGEQVTASLALKLVHFPYVGWILLYMVERNRFHSSQLLEASVTLPSLSLVTSMM